MKYFALSSSARGNPTWSGRNSPARAQQRTVSYSLYCIRSRVIFCLPAAVYTFLSRILCGNFIGTGITREGSMKLVSISVLASSSQLFQEVWQRSWELEEFSQQNLIPLCDCCWRRTPRDASYSQTLKYTKLHITNFISAMRNSTRKGFRSSWGSRIRVQCLRWLCLG